jgi:hypothetical protein
MNMRDYPNLQLRHKLKYRKSTFIAVLQSYGSWIYDFLCCEFEYQSGWGVQYYVIKFVSDLWQVSGFLRVLWFLHQ